MSTKTVDFYFDYASPWAYVANELVTRKLPGVTIVHRPIYLRGLETFSQGVPYGSAKLAYLTRDLQRCADYEGVPLTPPASFPINGIHALRAAYVALDSGGFDRFHRAAFRGAWAEGRDISEPSVVAAILADAIGSTAAVALESMTAQAVKDRVRAATDEAVARGVFGTPTFFVNDEMFWGHDRMDYVGRALAKAKA